MTNDDDGNVSNTVMISCQLSLLFSDKVPSKQIERYSIQAHKSMLRNLVIQAADSPLGYPVWTSTESVNWCSILSEWFKKRGEKESVC
jgi:hypothetical protein